MTKIIDGCQLEVDPERGVIYVHHPEGFTALRICGCPSSIPDPSPKQMLDITLKFSGKIFSWGKDGNVFMKVFIVVGEHTLTGPNISARAAYSTRKDAEAHLMDPKRMWFDERAVVVELEVDKEATV